MKSVNKVTLIGNLVRDPEITQVGQGSEVAKFSIAINESYKKQDGTQVENTIYIDCEAWGGLTKVVGSYLHKGSKVYVDGSIKVDTWTDADTGKSRSKYKVRISDLVMLDSKGSGSYSNATTDTSSESGEEVVKKADDDELPF